MLLKRESLALSPLLYEKFNGIVVKDANFQKIGTLSRILSVEKISLLPSEIILIFHMKENIVSRSNLMHFPFIHTCCHFKDMKIDPHMGREI